MQSPKNKIKLGLFTAGGLALFIIAIFIIGKQQYLFNPVFKVSATFRNVSGLEVGSNIRFSGINVGTVDNIQILNDTTVIVNMLIRNDVQRFIKSDCEAGIGSTGIIGDKILTLSQGSQAASLVKKGQHIASKEPVETDVIMVKLKETVDNTVIVSKQLAEIMEKINHGNGIIGRIIQDSVMADNINEIIISLKKSSVGLNENMNAAKDNFLLRGYFKKKEKAAQEAKEDAEEKKQEEQKEKQNAD